MNTHVKIDGKFSFIVSHPVDWEPEYLKEKVLKDINGARTIVIIGEELKDIADLEYDKFGNLVSQ